MNVGILSYSSVCQRKFLPALLLNDRVREITIASSRHLDLNEISKKINCVSYENFFQKDYDWVYISSIPSKNFEFSKKCLKNGWHVLCEKPSFLSKDNYSEIIKIAKTQKLLFMENYTHTLHPRYSLLKKILSNQQSEVKYIDFKFFYPGPNDKKNFRYHESMGGGVQFDSLGYLIDTLIYLSIIDKPFDFKISQSQKNGCVNFINIASKEGNKFISLTTGIDLQYDASISFSGDNWKIVLHRAFAIDKNHTSEIVIQNGFNETKQLVDSSDQFKNMINLFINTIKSKEDIKFGLFSHHLNTYNVRSTILKNIYNNL